jgi:predicted ATPase
VSEEENGRGGVRDAPAETTAPEPVTAAIRIFLSYRRDDAEGYAGRLSEALRGAFRPEQVFRDIEAIAPGANFLEAIDTAVASCDVLLALIGSRWLEAAGKSGRRLDDPDDVLRLELEAGLAHQVRVIPLLVHGAKMPRPDELPEPLRALAFRNALELSEARWEYDVQRLVETLGGAVAVDGAGESRHVAELPAVATPLIGRESELEELRTLVVTRTCRLVTLIGPGGIGKTRLAIALARSLADELLSLGRTDGTRKTRLPSPAAAEASDAYPGGVFWVPLAPLRDPALVLRTVAAAVGVGESVDGSPLDDLANGLAGRRLLVFVDNVEHLLPGAADALHSFVAACPTVMTVLTSRERLRIPGERVYAVPPMSESDAEALFRSRAADAGVELEASEELRMLCGRLDNLPLALELAAARTVVFSPAQLFDRLAQRLDLLKGGRGVDARQQTLRATIGWSHDLLSPEEQQLFRRMSVFAGSCSFESAEQVAGADPDVLQSLLDKSLLRRRESKGGPRFWMLETIREFAAEELESAGEANDFQRRHLAHYAAVAGECYDETLQGNDDLNRLEEERENLRLALNVAVTTDPVLALELASRLMPSWNQRGDWREGREQLAAALACSPDKPGAARAWALRAAAYLATKQSDLEIGNRLASEALACFRELGDQRGAGFALHLLGWNALWRGDYGEARGLFEEAVEASSGAGDEQLRFNALDGLANVAANQGDHRRAIPLHREVVARARRAGSTARLATVLNNLGVSEDFAGETEQGQRSLEESVSLFRQADHKPGLADALVSLGHVTRAIAPVDALAHYSESLRLAREIQQPDTIALCLEGGAAIFAARGDSVHATSLLGAASTIRTQTGAALPPHEQAEVATVEAQCRDALSAEAFARAWDDGSALDSTVAADWALQIWEGTE